MADESMGGKIAELESRMKRLEEKFDSPAPIAELDPVDTKQVEKPA
jgi:hypothetical protein